MLSFDIHGDQIQGARLRQEDRFGFRQIGGLTIIVVADGLGGHPCGDRAAQLGMDAVFEYVEQAVQAGAVESRTDMLVSAVESAHKRIRQAAGDHRDPESGRRCFGMATTLVVVCVSPDSDRLHYACAGDSLLLRLSLDEIEHIAGPKGESSWMNSAAGFALTVVECNETGIPIAAGDKLLLATDGLLSVPMTEVADVLMANDKATTAAEVLLRYVEGAKHEYQDNATVVALYVGGK